MTAEQVATPTFFEKHKSMLDGAVEAVRSRNHWSSFPEVPSGKIYGETAKADGWAAFDQRLGQSFALSQPSSGVTSNTETSPYGLALGITYPTSDLDTLLPAMESAMSDWRSADVEARVGVCLEILYRLGAQSFEMANAIMHTTGQAFMMAFQAGGPHALDRGLEAVAYAYESMTACPREMTWEKRVSKEDVVRLKKNFRVVPRGIAVTIGCSTFPTWNGYPGLFASLVTGNAVAVKPHPAVTLPLAIAVETCREVLAEAGFDANVVTLVANGLDHPEITKELVKRPEVAIIDYTGGNAFGDWIEENCRHAVVFTEKAGVNSVVIDSVEDLRAVTGNLAFSVSLYSGQMCTAPQNIYIPEGGIKAGEKTLSFDEVTGGLVKAVSKLLGDPQRAVEVLGAVQNPDTLARLEDRASSGAKVLLKSEAVPHEKFPDARIRTPLILEVTAAQRDLYMPEAFGPIVFVIKTADTDESLALAAASARENGAITSALYTTDDAVLERGIGMLTDAGASVSCNLTGPIYVNQAAAFSDFHVSGANPAGNATLCDAAFVSNRFRFVQSRVPA